MVNLTLIALGLTIPLLLALAGLGWVYRQNRGAKSFIVLQLLSALWAAVTMVALTTPPGSLRLRLFGVTSGLSLLVIIFWTAFILSYTGREHWVRPGRLGLGSLPLVVGAGLYFAVPTWPPLVGDVAQSTIPAGTVVSTTIGPVGGGIAVYLYLVFLVGIALVVKTVLEGSRLFVGQALAFIGGSLITILGSLLVVFGVGGAGYPFTQLALGPQAALWAYAIFGQRFLRVVPAVAEIGERAILEDIDEGVLVVNEDGVIVQTNPQVAAYLDAADLTGDPITTTLAAMDVTSLEELPARFDRANHTYRADASVIRDWQGEPVGRAVIISDITQVVTREQRLAVLNRILRHNLRNDMNVVLGIGEHLQARPESDIAAHGQTLIQTAQKLDRVSEKALKVDRMFERTVATETVSLDAVLGDIRSDLTEEYPEATVETSIATDSVHADWHILEAVLREVVANALEHTGESPVVQIEAQSSARATTIVVTDDGPGIPDPELQPLRDGDETALEHTSSFGLWFTTWGMQKLGGDVDISVLDSGTQVTLEVPVEADGLDGTTGSTVPPDA